jgi:hypothetical protein
MTQELSTIERALPILQQGPQILKDSRERFTRATTAGENLLLGLPSGIQNAEQDELVRTFIEKSKKTLETLNTNRAEFTKAIDIVKGEFTGLEGALDIKKSGTVTARAQGLRNDYAKRVFEEQERQRKAAELQKKKDDENATIISKIRVAVSTAMSDYTFICLRGLTNSFNAITIDDYDVKRVNLLAYTPGLNAEKYNELAYQAATALSYLYHTAEEIQNIAALEVGEQYEASAETFKNTLLEKKIELVDMLPSKLQELQKVAEFEAQQKMEREEQARLAAEAAKADGERKAELQRQQAEQQQRQKEQAEQEQLRQQREAERLKAEQHLLEQQRAERDRKEKERIEQDRIAAETINLFDATSAVTPVDETPKIKTALRAVINHPSGAVQIFQMWFSRVGIHMTIEELTKKLSFCFTEVNKAANKDGETISSKFINYENEIKAK